MAHIRALSRSDLPAVTTMMREHLPGPAADERFLADALLDEPWADPELPSLVAEDDDGAVVGSIACQVRRMRFGRREVRGVCCSHLLVDPAYRGNATGALLLGALLKAGQDLTWSETASNDVVRIWQVYGGRFDAARACDWMLVLNPLRWIRDLGGAARRRSVARDALPVGAAPAHMIARGRLGTRLPQRDPDVRGEDATPAAIAAEVPAMARGAKLFVEHDEAHLGALVAEIERQAGPPVLRLVRRGGRAIGWYLYLAGPGRPAHALHVSAAKGEIGPVFDDLVRHAEALGAGALSGRAEPHLAGVLRERLAILGYARQPVFHAADPELRAEVDSPTALVTRLDGEWFAT